MANKAVFLRVGLLVVVGVAATVGVVLFLGKNQVRHGLEYETYFQESVQGLDVGATVKYRGVTLGQVTEIALVSAAYPNDTAVDDVRKIFQLVVVRYAVDPAKLGASPALDVAVAQGLRTRLASQGLTGLAYLELDFVDPKKFPVQAVPWTPLRGYIPSMPSTVAQLQDAVTVVMDQVKTIDFAKLAGKLQSVMDDIDGQMTSGELKAVLTDTAAVTHVLRQSIEAAHLDEMAADLRASAASLKQLSGGKETQALLARTTVAVEQLNEVTKRLPAMLNALQGTVRRGDDGLSDVTGALVPVLRDARAAAANLRDMTEALRRYPAAALLGGPPTREGNTR